MKECHIKLQVDSLAVNLHDAVVLYALGLNKSITEGTEDCKVIKQDISNVTFEGTSNRIYQTSLLKVCPLFYYISFLILIILYKSINLNLPKPKTWV